MSTLNVPRVFRPAAAAIECHIAEGAWETAVRAIVRLDCRGSAGSRRVKEFVRHALERVAEGNGWSEEELWEDVDARRLEYWREPGAASPEVIALLDAELPGWRNA